MLYLHVREHYIETFWSIMGVNWGGGKLLKI